MLEQYYKILEISEDASLFEIKRAFRNKAKELHRDVNKSLNAHEQFILLLEAYEYLVSLKTNETSARHSNGSQEPFRRWQDSEAARARHRAEYFSKINYEKRRT